MDPTKNLTRSIIDMTSNLMHVHGCGKSGRLCSESGMSYLGNICSPGAVQLLVTTVPGVSLPRDSLDTDSNAHEDTTSDEVFISGCERLHQAPSYDNATAEEDGYTATVAVHQNRRRKTCVVLLTDQRSMGQRGMRRSFPSTETIQRDRSD